MRRRNQCKETPQGTRLGGPEKSGPKRKDTLKSVTLCPQVCCLTQQHANDHHASWRHEASLHQGRFWEPRSALKHMLWNDVQRHCSSLVFCFCFLPVSLGLLGLTRHIWRRHLGWAHCKKLPLVHKAGTPSPPEFTGFESVLLPQLLLHSTHKFSKTPPLCHYCPSSKPSPFWVQYNRLGLALQTQNVDRCWNGGMAHRGLFISSYLFGRNRSCLTVSRTNVVGGWGR